jgi:Fic/DOC family
VADWDDDSPLLRRNLETVLKGLAGAARRRELPLSADARAWQRQVMAGLDVPSPTTLGRFRGEPGLERVDVRVGSLSGARAERVAGELAVFDKKLRAAIERLDMRYPALDDLDADGLNAVIDVAGWAHAHWVRIHPFANGNGRTARLWANFILMRYGIPPVVRLRPRPDGGYGAASAKAMRGDWKPTAETFRRFVYQTVQPRR